MKDDEAKRSVPKEDEGYDVVPPQTPVYREGLPGRPTLRDDTLHDDTRREGTRNDVQLRRTTDGCVRKETTIPNNRRTSYAYIGFIHKVHQAANAFLTIHEARAWLGFEDDEFPEWKYRPARSKVIEHDETRTTARAHTSTC